MADTFSIGEPTGSVVPGPAQVQGILAGMTNLRHSTFRKGEVLCREGSPGRTVLFLHTGKIKLVRKDKLGRKFLLGLLGPGDTVGLQAILHREAYTSTAIAIEQIQASYVDADTFLQWLSHRPDRLHQILQLLCVELERVENRMYTMTRASASARLAETLLMLDKTYGATPAGSLTVRLKPREYADLINVARGTIYRLLKQFADTGLINFEGSTITLLDRMRLVRIAQL
jgi:CRP-like cAMP-binding protein